MSYSLSFRAYFEALGLKLTLLRKEVLYILWRAQKPLKAYEILNELLKVKSNATPPTVYRALLFFLDAGIVHKIESIQSFTLCCSPQENRFSDVLVVCHRCHQVVEIHNPDMHLLASKIALSCLFKLQQDAIELTGTCQQCS